MSVVLHTAGQCSVPFSSRAQVRRKNTRTGSKIAPLAREASDLQRALDALNGAPVALAPDGRRTRRQSHQSAPARRSGSAREDIRIRVLEYVAANPGSTASDVAKALGLNRKLVATRLTELSKRGDLVKAPRGYSAP